MASPMLPAPTAAWHAGGQPTQPTAAVHEPASGVRAMSLKVHYTFDKDGKINYLARYPHTIQVQTIPLDELSTNTIGVVDLRACIQAVTDCSPELTNHECDYTIYAIDYSEPNTPLVGQGMLTWAVDSMRGDVSGQQLQIVTGKVTKNLLAVFGGGNKETLEVRLKLIEATKVARPGLLRLDLPHPQPQAQPQQIEMPQPHPQHLGHVQPQLPQQLSHPQPQHPQPPLQQPRPMERAMTPTSTSEWNTFINSNPQIGHSANIGHVARTATPALSQEAPPSVANCDAVASSNTPLTQPGTAAPEVQKVAPTLVDATANSSKDSSRPSSRTSNRAPRRRPPTGRPRGRPRKKPAEGNTSGYEDGTEGEEGPAKKRVKTTKVDKTAVNAFASEPESLRVAASTSGSLRAFRPISTASNPSAATHLQDVPRAPTPVPDSTAKGPLARQRGAASLRRQSTALSQEMSSHDLSQFHDGGMAISPSQDDARSPESAAPTPVYSVDSPADIGSSPPVARTTPFIRSSPPPSSPVLPPMPPSQLPQEVSFTTTDMDDLFGEMSRHDMAEVLPSLNSQVRRAIEMTDDTGIPMQVFRLEDGPDGKDLVNIRNVNTRVFVPAAGASFAPALFDDTPSLPPLRQQNRGSSSTAEAPAKASNKSARPPLQVLTPPPTTDATEKPASPTPAATDLEGKTNDAAKSTETAAPSRSTSIIPPPPQNQPPTQSFVQGPSMSKQRPPRHLGRSQSAGPLALPMVAASEPAGPSSLNQCASVGSEGPASAVPDPTRRAMSIGPLCLPVLESNATVSTPISLLEQIPVGPGNATHDADRRATSTGPLGLSVPDSDTVASTPVPLAEEATFVSGDVGLESFPAPSSPQSRSNKNIVKKHAIKQRLEEAISNGEMPPFCSNCGAIETPTWRKIWVQEHKGIPEYVEYSEKPGRITAIEILKRDEEQKPTLYRLVKKSLAPTEDKSAWQEMVLCNPCGIWLSKCKSHRPANRWDKDASRKGQERRKRGSGPAPPRTKRTRTKSDAQNTLTSEAYLPTDALGPMPESSPKPAEPMLSMEGFSVLSRSMSAQDSETQPSGSFLANAQGEGDCRSMPGSSHSQGTGTVNSPIDLEMDEELGHTRRVLFPSPKKDDRGMVLNELHVNIVQTECRQSHKEAAVGQENSAVSGQDCTMEGVDDELEALFRSPAAARPSTPPPNSKPTATSGPFKTPTRPTPSHRPVTRSVSRTIRSIRSLASPDQLTVLQATPTRSNGSKRRSPRNIEASFDSIPDTPISRTIMKMLSEGNDFCIGENDLDLGNLPALDGSDVGLLDFGSLLSTDAVMPSSPPRELIGFDYDGSQSMWEEWNDEESSGKSTRK
ncbi:hypothetical protein S40288_09101 [Stachybotrys chartarum IBT 40288]|nr:hypothetical protein S40288_09101 [Stachybotrys chartarum IBT 40288]